MIEILIAVVAFVAGSAIAWLLRGSRAGIALAETQSRQGFSEQRLTEKTQELEVLKAEHGQALESLRTELVLRAAAEATVARVPELEARLAERDRVLSERLVKLAELETRITEERKAAEEKLTVLKQAESAFSDAFKALSLDALKSNNQSFIELAKATLEKFQEGARSELDKRQKAVDEQIGRAHV